ncbi:helix-turn-helix domain-containing protein [Flavobacterium branchiicola]|uniref:Helix-turn-helix domain-containing protein n=1 Tax=Flavobacterium branchiicola TaxID=1114875 RepID=A0ABV9PAX5_9FLAO|nr:AraC family transcriptional regulator [Flavobacterium branchiicola]MBS7254292.1 helix-turn-helix transcriptional regulator [Flavobacterium branchiicola]
MKKVNHYFSLTPEWLEVLAEQVDTQVIDNKIILFPENIGQGHAYFTQINSGISVFFLDLSLNIPLKITRESSPNELFVFHYELSQHVNLIKINNEDYKIGSFDQLDLAIIDNEITSAYKPSINERTFAVRILVSKSLLGDFIKKYPKIEYKEDRKNRSPEAFYHYGNIDSNSALLLKSIKSKNIHDLSFDSYLKGISLKLLGNFFGKFYDTENKNGSLTQVENDAINKTRDYLLSNLYGPFPSVIFLAAMAGMSESKYKMSFKKSLDMTPNNFFIKEKMSLGRNLLKSGKFHTLTEIMYELNYSKLSYFSSKYFELFGCKPIDDFVKK